MAFKVVNASAEQNVSGIPGTVSNQATAVDPVTGQQFTVGMDDSTGTPLIRLRTLVGPDVFFDGIINPGGGASGFPSIAHLATASQQVVVTWEEEVAPGDLEVFARIFDINGDPTIEKIHVNSLLQDDYQDSATVTALPGGGFVIAWESFGPDGDGYGISFQVFDGSGNKIGSEKQANTAVTAGDQQFPVITAIGGGFVVAWQNDDGSLWYRQYDSLGNPTAMTIGGEQQIGSAGAIKQLPTIAALPGGGWAAVWQQAHPLSGQNILAQTFDAAGTAGPIQTVSAKPGNQTDPSVAVLTDGGFVVAWTDGAGDVWQHLFDSAWQPLGPDLLVGTTEPGNLSAPTVSALADGGWLVSWTGPDGDGTGVFQRSYAGSPSGNLSPGDDIVLGTAATETLKVEAGEITAGDQLYGGGGGDNLQIVGEKLTIQATAAISGFDELLGAASDDDVIVENGNLPFAQIDLGIGTDTLVFDGTANLIGKVVKGVEKIVLLNDSDISLDDKALALLVSAPEESYNVLTLAGGGMFTQPQINALFAAGIDEIHDANGAFFAPALAETAFNTAEEIPGANIGTLKGKVGAPTLTLFGNYNGLFELVPISGDPADGYALKLKAGLKLDYETDLTTIVLKVEVSDINGTVVEDVVVTLQAVNEYTPQILSPAAYNVAENTTEVTTVIAIDGDKDTTLTYSITGTDATFFTIDAKTGKLDFKDAPDRESPQDAGKNNVYDVVVHASDGDNTASKAVKVTVTNQPDGNAPVIVSGFGQDEYTAGVNEGDKLVTMVGPPAGGFVNGHNVVADDKDGDPITYSIVGGADKDLFTIDAKTGELSLVESADYEDPLDVNGDNIYEVVVKAFDGVNSDTQALHVAVNSQPDGFAPQITSPTSIAVDENTAAPVTVVTATDLDADGITPLVFSIVAGADKDLFVINPSTGRLSFKNPPDWENPQDADKDNVYEVFVRVTDNQSYLAGQNHTTKKLLITVNDVNDGLAPVITSDGGGATAAKSVVENTKAVTTVTATDGDTPASNLTYSIKGGADAALFEIDPVTGALTFKDAPNFENPQDVGKNNVYDVVVKVYDGVNSDDQAIAVKVKNVIDGVAPVIGSFGGSVDVTLPLLENKAAVVTIGATDADGDNLTYTLSGDDAARFAIDQATGALTFNKADVPDYEQPPADQNGDNIYDVTVKVSDGDHTVSQTLHIEILDENDNAPVIAGGPSAFFAIDENTTAPIATIAATDKDAGTTLEYSISGGGDANLFTIDKSTGVLSFIAAPDFDDAKDIGGDNVYDVTVAVFDGKNIATQDIAVKVGNLNDNDPVIASNGGGTAALVTVDEGTTAVTTVAATDKDNLGPLSYSIVGGADAALLKIDAATGALAFVAAPDFETAASSDGDNVYEVIVQVSDGLLIDTQAISIEVTNVNDNPPSIISDGGGDTASLSTAENQSGVTNVVAVDKDKDALTYSIAGGADETLFNIDPTTGLLTFKASPDFENPQDQGNNNVYDVVVKVSDGVNSKSQQISVTVIDVDELPTIVSNGGGAAVSVSVAENTTAVADVDATDPEGGALTYAIAGGADAALFEIDGKTGVLAFKAAPDFENPKDQGPNNVYDVVVTVSDGTNSDSQAIKVTVTDVADGLAPVFTSFGGADVISPPFPENQTKVAQMTATDADSAVLVFTISGGADKDLFAIDPATGVLTFKTAPDFENPTDVGKDNVYDVIVDVSDGVNSDTQRLLLKIKDVVGENPPVIGSNGGGDTASISLAENTTTVTTVTATDADMNGLAYSIVGGADAALFTIVEGSGKLSFKATPDFEAPQDQGGDNTYDVIVMASDGILTDTEAISVTVTNVNDNTPSLTSDGGGATASKSVAENSTAVTDVDATDADKDTLTYSIAGGDDAALFTIDSSTGVLTFKDAPDFESPQDKNGDNIYDVTVEVSDGVHADAQAIAVTVTNVADGSPPVIGSNGGGATASVSLAENLTVVTTVAATDADKDGLTYSIAGGADAALFAIDAASGALTFKSAPDFEDAKDQGKDNVYDVIVKVSDSLNSDTQALAVTVTNLNDNGPTITSNGGLAFGTATVAENVTAVTTVTATDADKDALTYSIAGGVDAALFEIDAKTGALSFKDGPDFENPADTGKNNVYDVIVKVSDGVNSDTQNLAVTVTDVPVDGLSPVITSNGGGTAAAVAVLENGKAVTDVDATDGDTSTLTYSISGGADALLFDIDTATGVLTFKAAPDFETPTDAGNDNVYDVIVKVSDGNYTDSQQLAVTVGDRANESPPQIVSDGGGDTASVDVDENTTEVTKVVVDDKDSITIQYDITGGPDAALFVIDPDSGQLSFMTPPDFESQRTPARTASTRSRSPRRTENSPTRRRSR